MIYFEFTKKLMLSIITLAVAAMLFWALRFKRKSADIKTPEAISKVEFLRNVKTGDLLLTKASNNLMSYLHVRTIRSAVSHVGLAVVDKLTGKVYMFESGAPRGAQLRDLDEYMSEGADFVWWRKLSDFFREDVMSGIEKYSTSPYSWGFLRHLPREILGIESPGQERDKSRISFSCAELVAKIYEDVGALGHRRSWLPLDFMEEFSFLSEPKNVIF